MFFMSKKRFEEELDKRMNKEREAMHLHRRIDEIMDVHYRNVEKIEHRLAVLEEAVFEKKPTLPAERVLR